MEVIENEFLVTSGWLAERKIFADWLRIFEIEFKNGFKSSDLFAFCKKNNMVIFASRLALALPFNKTDLVLDRIDKPLCHNGNVIIKGDIELTSSITAQGTLTVEGNLIARGYIPIDVNKLVTKNLELYNWVNVKGDIQATNIEIHDRAGVDGNIDVNTIITDGESLIYGNIKAKDANFINGRIWGNIFTDKLRYSNFICGDVSTIEIEEIYGGKIDGKISLRSSLSSNNNPQ